MADFHLKYGSQRVDISAEGQRIVVNEQLIDYSDDKRKHRSESSVSTAATTFFAENDDYCLHVGNLPYDTTEHDLRKLFSGYNISDARIPARRRNDRTRSCGFVDMTSLRDAQNAIKSLSGVIFLGREVTVMMSRSSFSTAAVREEHDEEPPEKKLKRGSDWGRDVKNSMSQGLKYKERSSFASPQPLEPVTLSTEPTSVKALALEFAQLWLDEYAGPDTGPTKRTESLAGLLLELDVPDSKLHEHISRTFMARAASQKKEMV